VGSQLINPRHPGQRFPSGFTIYAIYIYLRCFSESRRVTSPDPNPDTPRLLSHAVAQDHVMYICNIGTPTSHNKASQQSALFQYIVLTVSMYRLKLTVALPRACSDRESQYGFWMATHAV